MSSVIQLPASTNPVSQLSAETIYQGVPGRTIFDRSAPLYVRGSNVTVRGCTFTTGGLRRDDGLVNLTVEDCVFRGCHVGVENNSSNGLTIRRSLFDHCDMPTWLNNGSDYLIENNEIVECGYGFKAFGNDTRNRNRVFRLNFIHDCPEDFMAFELQGFCTGWQVVRNLVQNIRFGPLKSDNDHSLLMSLPMDLGADGLVSGNAVLGQKPRDAGDPGSWINGHPLLMEIGGDNTLVKDNLFMGGGTACSITDRVGSCSVTFENNLIRDTYRGCEKNTATQVMKFIGSNNASTVLLWTLAQLLSEVGLKTVQLPPIVETVPKSELIKVQEALSSMTARLAMKNNALQQVVAVANAGLSA